MRAFLAHLLDQRAWCRDVDRLTGRVEALNATEEPDREELLAAASALLAVSRAPIDGYRATRRARLIVFPDLRD